MKLLLCMTVVGASLAIGVYLSSRLSERTKLLEQFITLLEAVAVKMAYTGDELAVLFADNFAGYCFSEREPFDGQFGQMVRQYRNILKSEDIRLLDELARQLGASDTASQQRHIRLYITLLKERLDAAREDERKKGRLYRILPLSAGIAAAILFI